MEEKRQVDIRKVLSKSQREKKGKEYKTGLAMLKEAVKRSRAGRIKN